MSDHHTTERIERIIVRALRITLRVIGVFQFALGALFLLAPGVTATTLKLGAPAPSWATWLLAMMSARFIGYGVGMFAAARDPRKHVLWINTMVVIQAVDWLATVKAMTVGHLGIQQVSTACFMPLVFIAVLAWFHPRRVPVE